MNSVINIGNLPLNPVATLQARLRNAFTHKTPVVTHRLQAPSIPKRHPKQASSRLACLHLINRLSRATPVGGTAVIIATLYLAALNIFTNPLGTLVWVALVGLSAGKLLWRNHAFRAGDQIVSARPFHWRACHTANMVVMATAFGAGLVFLFSGLPVTGVPSSFTATPVSHALPIIAGAGVILAVSQIAHMRAMLGALVPVAGFSGWALLQQAPTALAVTLFTALCLCVGTVLVVLSITAIDRAERRYPRTTQEQMPDITSFRVCKAASVEMIQPVRKSA